MLFSALLMIAIIYLIIFVLRLFFVKDKAQNKDRRDSIEILKARYAGGEISEEEYIRMRDILTN